MVTSSTAGAAYLRRKYCTRIATNKADEEIVEKGDLFYNRNANFLMRITGQQMLFFLRDSLKKDDNLKPDMHAEEGFNLSEFGFGDEVIYLPGHSKGSSDFLRSSGDLLENTKKPAKNSLIADQEAFGASLEKLNGLKISIVYPGHGEPFQME